MPAIGNLKDHLESFDYSITHPSSILPQGTSYLFAIGIDHYKNFNKLFNAVKDAKEVVQILTTKYQFDESFVSIFFNVEATRRNIYSKLDEYARTITPEDTLFIYYSGHGIYNEYLEEGFWIPAEAKVNDTSSYISNSDISKHIRAIKAFHIVVISDSCFSGSLFGERGFFEPVAKLEAIQSRWLFTSGRDTTVSDGQPGKNSPFAENLLYHLENNKQPRLPLTELSRFVINAVGNNSEQLPRCEPFKDVKHRGGEFMFRLKGVLQEKHLIANPISSAYVQEPEIGNQIVKRKSFWIVTIVAIIIIGFWLIGLWKPLAQQSIAPSPAFSVVRAASKQLLIIQNLKNELFGYAFAKDTSVYISCKYEEANPFKKGIALVKIHNKYKYIKPDSSNAFPEEYGYAEDFEDGRAKVVKGKDTFNINTYGKKISDPHNLTADNTIQKGEGKKDKKKEERQPENNDSTPPPIKMCKAICDTKGIRGIVVSFTDPNTKKIYSSKSDGSDLVFDIPCDLMEQNIRVTFKGNGQSDYRNVTLKKFEIPEMFKSN